MSRHEDVEKRRLDLGLQELFGGDTPPDVRGSVARRMQTRRGRPILTAAIVLLGLAVLVVVLYPPFANGTPTPAPNPNRIGPDEPVRVHSVSELLALPSSTSSLWLIDFPKRGLPELSRFSDLRALRLAKTGGPRIGDDELAGIAEIESLERLELIGVCSFSQLGRRHLARLHKLRVLYFPAKLFDADLAALAGLPDLRELLGVDASHISAAGLAALRPLRIRRLDLSRPFGHHAIRGLPKTVEWLSLTGLDLDAAELQRLTSLRELQLSGSSIDDVALKGLVGHPLIRSLHLADCPRLGASALDTITSIEGLTELSLEDAGYLDDRGLARIARLPQLEKLVIRGNDLIHDSGLENLARLSFLEEFTLTDNSKITDRGLVHIGQVATIRRLDLSNSDRITEAGLNALTSLPLQSLSVKSCARVYGWALDSMFKPEVRLTLPNGVTVGTKRADRRK